MKNSITKLMSFILVAAMLLCASPIAVFAGTDDNDYDLLFGRNALSESENGEVLVRAYDAITEGIEDRLDTISLDDININVSDLDLIMEAYFNDPTGHFWIDQGYSYASYTSGKVAYLVPVYNSLAGRNEDELENSIEIFEEACEDILKKAAVRSSMSDYEKELRIHNELVKRVVYSESTNAHNAYGAAVDGIAVCQGYTLAFNYLLRLCGVQAYTVHGISGGGPHCWSLVRIDGKYYHTDITWADPIGETDMGSDNDIFYSYFNITEDRISLDHDIASSSFSLPLCDSTEAGYYTKNPKTVFKSDVTTADMASLLKNGMIRIHVASGDYEAFTGWLSNNIYDLFVSAGYDITQPISYSITYLADEYHIFLVGTLIEPDITYVIGDMNNDGNVDAKDSNLLLRIIAGSLTPNEEQTITGDINGDGEINAKDSNLIKRIISGALTA